MILHIVYPAQRYNSVFIFRHVFKRRRKCSGTRARLAALGYKQEFKRAFTPLEARLIYLISFKTSVLTNLIVGFWNRVLDYRSGTLNIVGSFLRDSQRRWARHGLGGYVSLVFAFIMGLC